FAHLITSSEHASLDAPTGAVEKALDSIFKTCRYPERSPIACVSSSRASLKLPGFGVINCVSRAAAFKAYNFFLIA
ncbi:MAG: hypothetical protein ACFCUR_08145, partial [Rhodomicrobiaceae bacterium]